MEGRVVNELGTHDADYGVALAVEENLTAEGGAIAVELTAPKAVAQQDHGSGIGTKLLGTEPAAHFGRNAEEGESVAGNFEGEEVFGVGDAGERELRPDGSGGLGEGGNAGGPDGEIGMAEADGFVLTIEGLNFDDAIGIAEGDGVEESAIDDGEEGDVGGSSDGENGDDEERDVGILAKGAEDWGEVCHGNRPFSRFARWARGGTER